MLNRFGFLYGESFLKREQGAYFRSSKIFLLPIIVLALQADGFLEASIFLLFSLLVIHLADRITDLFFVYKVLYSLGNGIRSLKTSTPVFRDFQDYFGKFAKRYSAKNQFREPDHSRHFLFHLKPNDHTTYFGNFVLNIAPGISFVFTSYDPDELNPTRLAVLLHELGHCRFESWAKNRTYFGAAAAAFCIVILAQPSIVMLVLLVAYFSLVAIQLTSRRKILRFREELVADLNCVDFLMLTQALEPESEREKEIKMLAGKYLTRRRGIIPEDMGLKGKLNVARKELFRAIISQNTTRMDDATEFTVQTQTSFIVGDLVFLSLAILSAFLFWLVPGAEFEAGLELASPMIAAAMTLALSIVVIVILLTKAIHRFFENFLQFGEKKHREEEVLAEIVAQRIAGNPDSAELKSEYKYLLSMGFVLSTLTDFIYDFGTKMSRQRENAKTMIDELLESGGVEAAREIVELFDSQLEDIDEENRLRDLGRRSEEGESNAKK